MNLSDEAASAKSDLARHLEPGATVKLPHASQLARRALVCVGMALTSCATPTRPAAVMLRRWDVQMPEAQSVYRDMIRTFRTNLYKEIPEAKGHIEIYDQSRPVKRELARIEKSLGKGHVPPDLVTAKQADPSFAGMALSIMEKGYYSCVAVGWPLAVDKDGPPSSFYYYGMMRATLHEIGHCVDRYQKNHTADPKAGPDTGMLPSWKMETFADMYAADMLTRNGMPRNVSLQTAAGYDSDFPVSYARDAVTAWYDPARQMVAQMKDFAAPEYDQYRFNSFNLTGWAKARDHVEAVMKAVPVDSAKMTVSNFVEQSYTPVLNAVGGDVGEFDAWLEQRPDLPRVRQQIAAKAYDKASDDDLLKKGDLGAIPFRPYPDLSASEPTILQSIGIAARYQKTRGTPLDRTMLDGMLDTMDFLHDYDSADSPTRLNGGQLRYLLETVPGTGSRLEQGWVPTPQDFQSKALRVGGAVLTNPFAYSAPNVVHDLSAIVEAGHPASVKSAAYLVTALNRLGYEALDSINSVGTALYANSLSQQGRSPLERAHAEPKALDQITAKLVQINRSAPAPVSKGVQATP